MVKSVVVTIYRVTHLLDSNLPLTSKQKFCFGLTRSGQARPIRNFCFDVNGRFESTRYATLYDCRMNANECREVLLLRRARARVDLSPDLPSFLPSFLPSLCPSLLYFILISGWRSSFRFSSVFISLRSTTPNGATEREREREREKNKNTPSCCKAMRTATPATE